MKRLVFLFVLLLGSRSPLFAQLLLNPGDSWVYTFSSLPFQNGTNTFLTTTHGEFDFTVRSSSFNPGDSLAYEMFENATSEAPIYSGTLNVAPSNPIISSAPNGWQDVQGAVRFRMLSGSLIIDNVTLKAITTSPSLSSYNLYEDTFVPVPEPAVIRFLLSGGLAAFLAARTRKRVSNQ